MCGIAGFLNFDGKPADAGSLHKMIGMLGHRGPDAMEIRCEGPAGLGHSRLSIIDLAGGCQPMPNAGKSLWIIFNGEIFNYLELRTELEGKGHRFVTRSDTEVLLHVYQEYGPEGVKKLNGQWAFAIWNGKRRELFLSRDRLGVRPLFYVKTGRSFVFGSEMKALLAHPEVDRKIDFNALDETFTFWAPLPPRTFFKNIFELSPGHSMLVRDGDISTQAYWELQYPEPDSEIQVRRSEEDYAHELLDRLTEAARLRLRSDVPVGAYLSGGLDSTLITALIKRITPERLKTFSISFHHPEFDESQYQQEAAHYLETDHQVVKCSELDIRCAFPDVIWHTETPILRTAPAPLFLLSRFVRKNGYKVVLTGEGSDELFGGYDIFKEAKIRRFWARHPESAIRPRLLRKLYPYLDSVQAQPDAYLRAFFHVKEVGSPFFSHLPRWEMTSRLKLFFSPEVRAELCGRRLYDDLERRLPEAFPRWNWFTQAQYLESSLLFPGYILSSQGDRAAMAHSVEGRYPFLDPNVVEFACALPPRLKMKVLNEKYLVKRAAGDLIPPSVRQRYKQPYRAPEAVSFFAGPRNDYVEELLSPDRIADDGLFHPPAVQKLIDKVKQGQAIGIKDNMALVGILSTQLVVDQFLRNFWRRL